MMSSTTTYISHLLDRGEVAEETMAFHLERPAEFEFRAGQYIEVTLLAPPETDEEGNTRALSLVNAPSARELIVATRMRDTAFKRSLRGMATGTQLRIEGPMGSFTLHKNVSRASVLIAGGIGVTPFMSMLADMTEQALPREVYLFYSNGWPEYAPFLRHLHWVASANPHFHLIATMTEMHKSHQQWRGETGPIDARLLTKYLPSLQGPIYYLSGSTGMVAQMEEMLIDAGVDEDDIRMEQFGGY